MGTKGAKGDAPPLYLSFDDNSLLGALFGGHDRNLARIEQKIGVWITSRGNQAAISGPPSASERAKNILLTLYDMLQRGLPVGDAEVDGAIRMAGGEGPVSGGKAAGGRASAASGPKLVAEDTLIRTQRHQVMPRSPTQARYVRALNESELVFGVGPAGTGKTYLAVAVAAAMLLRGHVDRLVLSRPAVEAGERLGFLPGDISDKVDPYLRPLYDALHDMMPADAVAQRLQNGEIEIAPLAFMRGRTLANAFVILDEAQNTTSTQMKMFLTRLGENSRMVVTGDLSQVDLPKGVRSGLDDALEVTRDIKKIEVIRFTSRDVVRHPLVTQIVEAYTAREAGNGEKGNRGDDA